MLDPFALVLFEELDDLALVVARLVDRYADLATRAGHGPRLQAGQLAFDVEVADLLEIEHPLVIARPLVQVAAEHVVGQMVDVSQAEARGIGIGAGDRPEIDVVDAGVVIAVDEIDQGAADPFDRRNVELHRTGRRGHDPCAALARVLDGPTGILHPQRHGTGTRTVQVLEAFGVAARLVVQDEVDVSLPVERHFLAAMARQRSEAQMAEERRHRRRVRGAVLDELEAVGAHGVVPQVARAVGLYRCGHYRVTRPCSGIPVRIG